ncbi:MAG TPA: DUF4435 domain-containing protein [bacterium]|jgi:hypothetical protein
MSNLEHSAGALNNLKKFYKVDSVLFVEDDNDVNFWRIVLHACGVELVYVKPAGGVEKLKHYMSHIVDKNADIIVAADSDYGRFTGGVKQHDRILYTYGYSIENSLFTAQAIAHIVKLFNASSGVSAKEVSVWMSSLEAEVDDLLALDIANQQYGRGLEVMGDNCSRFLRSDHSCYIDRTKTSHHIKRTQPAFTNAELEPIMEQVRNSDRERWSIIRGHFLTNAVINYIKSKIKRPGTKPPPLPKHTLYVMTFQYLEKWKVSPLEQQFYQSAATRLMSSVA